MLRNFLFFSILLLIFGNTLAPLSVRGQDASRQDLLKLIPDPLPNGANLEGAPSFYGPDNLYQYMDGGADIFVLYGVRTLLHEDLKANSVDVTVDIFDMGSNDSAFGMYAAVRSPDYRFMAMGAEGYRNTGILNFLQGRFYVKLAGFGDGADQILESLARALSLKIGKDPALPALLSRL